MAKRLTSDAGKPALDLITSIKGLKFWRQGEQAVQQFQTGDIYVAVIHAGWCAFLRNAGQPVNVVHPAINASTKGVLKQGWIGLVTGCDPLEPEESVSISSVTEPLNETSVESLGLGRSHPVNAGQ